MFSSGVTRKTMLRDLSLLCNWSSALVEQRGGTLTTKVALRERKDGVEVDGINLSILCTEQSRLLKGHSNSVWCVARVSDDVVVSGSDDKTLWVWQL